MADTTSILPIDLTDDLFLDGLSFVNTGISIRSFDAPDVDASVFLEGPGLYAPKRRSPLNWNEDRPRNALGQYAAIPGATPKYSRHRPTRARENFDTIARMYIRVPKDRIPGIKASIQGAVGKDVASVLLGDGSSEPNTSLGYIDFFMDSIQTNLMEKVQVTEVLEDNFVAFFFGMSPPSVLIGGHLMNTIQDDWAVRMLAAYESIFRGTMLARRGLQFYLRYDSYILSGACTALTLTQTAANETIIPFTLQLLVHRRHLIYGDAYQSTILPASAGAFKPDGVTLSEPKPAQLRPFIAAPAAPNDSINETAPQTTATGETLAGIKEGQQTVFDETKATGSADAQNTDEVSSQSGVSNMLNLFIPENFTLRMPPSAPPSEPSIRNYMKR